MTNKCTPLSQQEQRHATSTYVHSVGYGQNAEQLEADAEKSKDPSRVKVLRYVASQMRADGYTLNLK